MKKIDAVKVVEILGMVFTVGGTIASAWAGKKNNDRTLEKLVSEQIKNK